MSTNDSLERRLGRLVELYSARGAQRVVTPACALCICTMTTLTRPGRSSALAVARLRIKRS